MITLGLKPYWYDTSAVIVAQERWFNGSILDKKAIMTVIESNLVLKDKKLVIEPKTPFLMIEKALQSGSNFYDEANIGSPPFSQTVLGG